MEAWNRGEDKTKKFPGNRRTWIWALLLLMISLLAGIVWLPGFWTKTEEKSESEIQKAYGEIALSCVSVQGGGHYGSGSIYGLSETEIVIASNRHVLEHWDADGLVIFADGTSATCKLLGLSDTADVGFAAVATKDVKDELLGMLQAVNPLEPVAAENLEEGTPYFTVNMVSDHQNPVCYEGMVVDARIWLEAFQMPMLLGKGEAVPGMSGGGVFDVNGNYLGMITGSGDEEMTAILPASEVAAAYEQIAK